VDAEGGGMSHGELGTGEGGWAMAVSREREGAVDEGRAVVAPSAGLQVRWERRRRWGGVREQRRSCAATAAQRRGRTDVGAALGALGGDVVAGAAAAGKRCAAVAVTWSQTMARMRGQ
jgi:hypothetical protein